MTMFVYGSSQLTGGLFPSPFPGLWIDVPVVGLGGANTFAETALRESRTEQYDQVGAVLVPLTDRLASVVDAVDDTFFRTGIALQAVARAIGRIGMAAGGRQRFGGGVDPRPRNQAGVGLKGYSAR